MTGILGALAIVLAFIGFGSLPLNIGGLLLIVLAMVLFVLELTVTSHGLLGIGGLICFVLGASALFTQPGDPSEPLATVAAPRSSRPRPRRGRGPRSPTTTSNGSPARANPAQGSTCGWATAPAPKAATAGASARSACAATSS